MNIFVITLLIFWILASLGRFVTLMWSRNFFLININGNHDLKKTDCQPNEYARKIEIFFIILIPVLREKTLINDIIEHFTKIKYNKKDKLKIALVSTQRESIDLQENQTTYSIVNEALSKLPKDHIFIHYCADGSDTCKGDQLNQALELFLSEFKEIDTNNIYVGVYDADSRPDWSIIQYLSQQINDYYEVHKSFLPAFQQIPVYFNNMNPSWNPKSIFLNARVLHNLDFALTREVPAMQASIDYYHCHGLKYYATAWLTHLIGHGEFIHFPVLEKVRFFRSPSADTSLGYVLAYLGIPIVPVPLFDVAETPHNFSMLIKQGATWYRGVSLYWRDFLFSTKIGDVNPIRATIMIIKVIYNNLAWAIFPLVVLFAFIMALVSGNQFLCYLAISGILIYLLPNMIQMIDYPNIQKHCSKFSQVPYLSLNYRIVMVFVYPLTKLFAMFGPWLHYFRKVKSLLGFNIEYQKTERILEKKD